MLRGTTGNTGTDKDNPVQKLNKEIDELCQKIREIQQALPEPGTTQANKRLFSGYVKYFTGISLLFVGYTTRKDACYIHIHGSTRKSAEAYNALNKAKNVAKLFERYMLKSAAYSRVESQVQIEYLLAVLSNLKEVI